MATLVPYDDRDGMIWLDGQLVPWREAKIHVLSHALHYASAVFEGERIYNGKVFKLHEHSQRLIDSGKMLGFDVPYTVEQLDAATATLAIALSTGVATTLVVALTVVGTSAARWRDIFGEHAVATPNLPAADRRGGALGDVAWGAVLTLPIVFLAALVSALLIQGTGAAPESPLPPSDDSRALLINLLSAVVVAPRAAD